jgi:hypothetical protein
MSDYEKGVNAGFTEASRIHGAEIERLRRELAEAQRLHAVTERVWRDEIAEHEKTQARLAEARGLLREASGSIHYHERVGTLGMRPGSVVARIDNFLTATDQPAAVRDDTRDATRYRWLRHRLPVTAIHCRDGAVEIMPADLGDPTEEAYAVDVDAAIDAAMTADKSSAL